MHMLITGDPGFRPITTVAEGMGKFMACYRAYYA